MGAIPVKRAHFVKAIYPKAEIQNYFGLQCDQASNIKDIKGGINSNSIQTCSYLRQSPMAPTLGSILNI